MKKTFNLIETLLWENKKYFLLPLHMERLSKSCNFFSFPFNKQLISENLKTAAKFFDAPKKYRVRLLCNKSGGIELTSEILTELKPQTLKIAVSNKKTDKNNIFLYHKTTNRALYDRESAKYQSAGFLDVVFVNTENEITEGTITNIIIQQGQFYFTPPVSCGLLEGTFRKHLLNTKKIPLKEKILYKKDILNADKIFTVNSVRKMVPVILGKV